MLGPGTDDGGSLRRRVAFTLGILLAYRVGVFVPLPGVDRLALRAYLGEQPFRGGLLNLFDLLGGGAFGQASVLALGVVPWVIASVAVQGLALRVPALRRLRMEGPAGRKTLAKRLSTR